MSKIDDLIAKYCPNGVEYKRLGEITLWDKRFNGSNSGIQPKTVSFKHIPAADLKNIPQTPVGTIRLLSTGNFSGTTSTELVEDKNIINSGEIISIPSGGAATIKYYKGDFIDSGNILAVSADVKVFNLKYIYHCLLNIQETLNSLFRGAGIKHPSMLEILQLKIPVPPLAVQEEIVNILDSFTLLEAELEAELVARKQQYEHYRDELLKPENIKGETKTVMVGDVADVTKLAGFEFTEHVQYAESGTIIALRGLNVRKGHLDINDIKYIDKSNFAKLTRSKLYKDDMLFTYVGTIGNVALIDSDDKYYLAPNVSRIRFGKNVIPKYALYVFQSNDFVNTQINKYLNSSSMKNLTMENIRKFKMLLPPLAEQERIVSILDKFDALVNDISDGLPAEINARRQQYEYYRNKLLNFEPMAA